MSPRPRASDDFFEGKSLGELLAEGFEELADAVESDASSLGEKFTCHRISLDLQLTAYNSDLVKDTRKILGASQAVFAQFLGVATKTVQSWERNGSTPHDMACRFMDEIRHDPEHWQARLRAVVVQKTHRKQANCT